MGESKTSKYYASNPEARKKRLKYQAEYNKKPEQVEKRKALIKEGRKRGTYGNGDNKDLAHTKNGIVLKSPSKNRGSKTDMPGDRRARGGK